MGTGRVMDNNDVTNTDDEDFGLSFGSGSGDGKDVTLTPTLTSSPSLTSSPTLNSDSHDTGEEGESHLLILYICIGVSIALSVVVLIVLLINRRRRHRGANLVNINHRTNENDYKSPNARTPNSPECQTTLKHKTWTNRKSDSGTESIGSGYEDLAKSTNSTEKNEYLRPKSDPPTVMYEEESQCKSGATGHEYEACV